MTDDEHNVLKANANFYEAFARRDIESMSAIWAEDTCVACIHPGWEPLRGRASVLASWMCILCSSDAPSVELLEARVYAGRDCAYVVCKELIRGSVLLATNIFVQEHGVWRLVHHHVGPGPIDAGGASKDTLH